MGGTKLLFFFAAVILLCYGKDATETQYAIGSEVVVASIRKIQDTCIFENDLLFLRRLAFVSSRDGDDLKSFWNSDKGKNGIWQTTSSMLSQVQSNSVSAITELQNQLGINVANMSWNKGDLDVPVNDAAVARLVTNQIGQIPLDVNDQANYWVNYYNPAGTPEQFIASSKQMPKCIPPGMDLIFIVDDSGSIGADVFQNVRNFLMTIIQSLQTGQSNRVGIVRFDDSATLIQALTFDLNAAYLSAQTMVYNSAGTDIASGLLMTYQQFTGYGRKDVPLIAILVTDGGDSDPNIVTQSDNLKNLGVNLFTIGVGSEAATDLLIWSSVPHCMFYYSLNNFEELANSFPELLNSQICDVTAVIPTTEACLNGTVQQSQYVFYQIPANPSNGVTVTLEMEDGSASIYISLTSRLPSSADFDFTANANVYLPGQIYISPQQLQTGASNSIVYAAIVGRGVENSFSLCNEIGDTVQNYTTAPPLVTNSSCISVDLIFILDRSQSVFEDYYNINVTNFVLEIANQYSFHDEASPGNPAFGRFGVIEFATDAVVTIPLGNYSRSEFNNLVQTKLSRNSTDGVTHIDEALMAAYFQFQKNSLMRNKGIVLVVDDVSKAHIQGASDALNKLKTYIDLPMGTVISGSWGDMQDSYNNLKQLIGDKGAFPNMDTAKDDMLDLMDSIYPCQALPACSAIIFVAEATTAIGPPNKITFLKLVSRLVNSIEITPNQRFGLVLYGEIVYKDVDLQTFESFNKTLNDYIRGFEDNDYPNGGTTYLTPVLNRLLTTINEQLYNSYNILLMGELQQVRNIGTARPVAQSIGASGANVYVLDETRNSPYNGFWDILTGNAYGHVINGTNATPELLYATFSQTIIPEFLARGC